MVSLTRRYLFHDRTRFALTLSAVSISLLLMFTMTGLYLGFIQQARAYTDNTGADLWVAAKGTPNFYFSASVLPLSLGAAISHVPGVQTEGSIKYQGGIVSLNGRNASVYYIGYNLTSGMGGPWGSIDGRSIQGNGEIVTDNHLASSLGARKREGRSRRHHPNARFQELPSVHQAHRSNVSLAGRAQTSEYGAGLRIALLMLETISPSVYPGMVLNFFHSGSFANVAQFRSRSARSAKVRR